MSFLECELSELKVFPSEEWLQVVGSLCMRVCASSRHVVLWDTFWPRAFASLAQELLRNKPKHRSVLHKRSAISYDIMALQKCTKPKLRQQNEGCLSSAELSCSM